MLEFHFFAFSVLFDVSAHGLLVTAVCRKMFHDTIYTALREQGTLRGLAICIIPYRGLGSPNAYDVMCLMLDVTDRVGDGESSMLLPYLPFCMMHMQRGS